MKSDVVKLHVEDLTVSFRTGQGMVRAVRGVNFDLHEGETLAIVGESGSGKSVSSRAIMGILAGNAVTDDGKIIYEGQDLTKVDEENFHEIRGSKIGMIFQDPMSSLNPIMKIGKQITEGMLLNGNRLLNKKKAMIHDQRLDHNELKRQLANTTEQYNNAIGKGAVKKAKKSSTRVYERAIETNRLHCDNDISNLHTLLKNSAVADQIETFKEEISKLKQESKNANESVKQSLKLTIQTKQAALSQYKKTVGAEEKKVYALKVAERKELLKKEDIDAKKVMFDTIEAAKAKVKNAKKQQLKADYKQEVSIITPKIKAAKKVYIEAKANANAVVNGEWETEKNRVNALIEEAKKRRDLAIQKILVEKNAYINARAKELSTHEIKWIAESQRISTLKKSIDKKDKVSLSKLAADKHNLAEAKSAFADKWNAEKDRINKLLKVAKVESSLEIFKLKEALRRFAHVTKLEARERAIQIMTEVGIKEPEKRINQYPFQFSGGMRQRIVIAIALTANPDVLICDEPTTALDVTIQAQILELINKLKAERNLSVIFITHDLGVVANMADRIAVMYAGKIVEIGSCDDIFYNPRHPYTWALLGSMPDLDSKNRLTAIPGTPPNMLFPPKGDAFAERNKYAMKIDFEQAPPMFKISDTHYAATWLLHPDAPKVDMPEVVKTRIVRMLDRTKAWTDK